MGNRVARVGQGQFAISVNKTLNTAGNINLEFIKNGANVDLVITLKIKPDITENTDIPEGSGSFAVFSYGTTNQYKGQFPDLVFSSTTNNDIYIDSKTANKSVHMLTGGDKGDHGEPLLNK